MKPEHRAIVDLDHQLRGPLSAALIRLNDILREKELDPSLEKEIRAIRGLCRKAERITESARLFVLLDSPEQTILLRRVRLNKHDLIKMLAECARDNEILLPPESHIRIIVDYHSFDMVSGLPADPGLVQQAVNCLIENAAKYSYLHKEVYVSARCQREAICITVTNYGLPIHPEEVSKCVEHGWRGERAKLVTAEGSGIGLWIVDNIMKVHKGTVLISPTTYEGKTQVHLVFPITE